MQNNYLVTKSNKLISANYNLSLQEQKIILTLASMVQPQDKEFQEYEFKIKDFMKLLEVQDKSKYSEIPKLTKELMKKVFEITEGNDIIQLSWLCSVRYKKNEGKVILKFAPDLKPYMLELKELYTSYKLENVLSLKSKYSIRMYEIMKSNLYKKGVTIDLEELKKMVGASEKAYNTYANFKIKVIAKAQEELKEKTDIRFEYEELKTSRKITSLKFYIQSNIKESGIKNGIDISNLQTEEENYTDLLNTLKLTFDESIGLSDKDFIAIYNAADGNIEKIKEKYSIAQNSNKPIPNFVGFMIDAIKKDYSEIKNYKPKGLKMKPDNYNSQRDYNITELEKALRGQEHDDFTIKE